MLLPLSASLEGPALTRTLGKYDRPPSTLTVAYTSASSLGVPSAVSLRASYQARPTLPVVWSTAMLGRNWLSGLGSFTTTGPLQVWPLLSEKRTKTLVSALATAGASV